MAFWLRRAVPYGLLVLTLVFAFWIRSNTFWLPHWQGDQSQYVTLAMKLANRGLIDYNLRHVEVRTLSLKGGDEWRLIYPRLRLDWEKGDMIEAYERYGLFFYDMPLFYKAPLFANALSLSHRWFTKGNHPYLVVVSNLAEKVWHTRPKHFFQAQAWAVVVPFASSLLVVILTFFFGKLLFGIRAGLYAAMIMATHPVDILSSNRLWTEGFLTFFVVLSLLIFFIAYHKKDLLGVALAGAACGLAVLSKQNAAVIILTVWAYTIFCDEHRFLGVRSWPQIILNPAFVVYSGACITVSAYWFWRIYLTYGTPVYEPDVGALESFDPGGWHTIVLPSRPHPALLFLVGIPYICPLFLGVAFSLKKCIHQMRQALSKQDGYRQTLFLWLWVIPMLFFFAFVREHSKEHRYLLPIYPALAILAAHVLDYLRLAIAKYVPRRSADVAVILLIVLSAARSIPMGIASILNEQNLIFEPF